MLRVIACIDTRVPDNLSLTTVSTFWLQDIPQGALARHSAGLCGAEAARRVLLLFCVGTWVVCGLDRVRVQLYSYQCLSSALLIHLFPRSSESNRERSLY